MNKIEKPSLEKFNNADQVKVPEYGDIKID